MLDFESKRLLESVRLSKSFLACTIALALSSGCSLFGDVQFPELKVDQNPVLFADVPLGKIGTVQVELSNPTRATLEVRNIQISGDGFALETLALPFKLTADRSQELTLTYVPVGMEAASGVLTIESELGVLEIPLEGRATDLVCEPCGGGFLGNCADAVTEIYWQEGESCGEDNCNYRAEIRACYSECEEATGACAADLGYCGDGRIVSEVGETCDNGEANGPEQECTPECRQATCGDGFVLADVEICDDGNLEDGDGCTDECVFEPGWRCSSGHPTLCQPTCGDGIRVGNEACDDGAFVNGDGCSENCTVEDGYECFVTENGTEDCHPICGDGRLFGDEECDEGNMNGPSQPCTPSCKPATCGDGYTRSGLEECDDANLEDGDGCTANCELEEGWRCGIDPPRYCEAICGDGKTIGYEECDDGNLQNDDGCDVVCEVEIGYECDAEEGDESLCTPICGDNLVIGTESCDLGLLNDDEGECTNSCQFARCGDGHVRADIEECDDGNEENLDACTSECKVSVCGDYFVRTDLTSDDLGYEECDEGPQGKACNYDDLDCISCTASCRFGLPARYCGDGILDRENEECDDGDDDETDGCLSTCKRASCGDGFVHQGFEECDDANEAESDACLSNCSLASCGDGFVQVGVEQCDDANQDNTDDCPTNCQNARCGDGFTQADSAEECDDGNENEEDLCLSTCLLARCGDGHVYAETEECDDGNENNQDDCLTNCRSATCGDGFVQSEVEECDDANDDQQDACLSDCREAVCGDGFVRPDYEECDDGDNNSDTAADGCRSDCMNAYCGDGVVDTGEECDLGESNTDTGSDGCRLNCMNAYCGDGIVDTGEMCDDGNQEDGDGCTSVCTPEATYVCANGPEVPSFCQRAFITTWDTTKTGTSNSTAIEIPLGNGVFNYHVDWDEDGIADDAFLEEGIFHDFGEAGTYRVGIVGDLQHLYFDVEGDKDKLVEINQWGDLEWTSMAGTFAGCRNLKIVATDVPDLSNVTSLSHMFNGATNFSDESDLMGTWDVSTIQDMSYVFANTELFDEDISGWDTSSATDMTGMFQGAEQFNQNITSWNTANVVDMKYMFFDAKNFDRNIGVWNTANVVDITQMFSGAAAFNGNLSGWNTSKLTSLVGVFQDAVSFDQDISSWNTDSVEQTDHLFSGARLFNQDISVWDMSKVTSMKYMFHDAVAFDQNLNIWDTARVTDMSGMFYGATNFNGDISAWDVGALTNADFMFCNTADFNINISQWKTSSIRYNRGMFYNATGFNQDIGAWNMSALEDASYLFSGAVLFDQDLSAWNVSKVRNMSYMFHGAISFDQDLSTWDVQNVMQMDSMLNFCGMSVANYDATLVGWSELAGLKSDVDLGADGLSYCSSATGRNILINDYSWSIFDDGLACP